ncbi:MAG: hypothetical protein EBU81_02915, partial [Proteobacteria bacterium]|nr:hypothetical protein [Pseudomonadota bacterium]
MSGKPKTAHSEAQEPEGIDLQIEQAGKGTTATVWARRGGEVVHCERLDLAKSKERQKFIEDLLDRLGEDAYHLLNSEQVEQQLAATAADLAAKPKAAPPAEVVELGDGRVVRPERFILPDVSGLTVPRRIDRGGEVVSEWMLYLRWQDGTREAIPLPEVLTVGSERVFITPQPPEPPPAMLPGWSAASRSEWLAGSTSMPPDAVCELLIEGFAKYLDLPPESAAGTVATLACYSLLSYIVPGLAAVPYIAVSGPMGSGKSRILELLQQVVFRPLLTSSTSEAAVFRSLHAFGHTALLDEAERLHDPEMQGVLTNLLAGYKRGGCATRCEAKGDGQILLRHFNVFGCKAFAAIKEVPPTLASRCIAVQMFRSMKGSIKPKRRVDDDAELWQQLRDALH